MNSRPIWLMMNSSMPSRILLGRRHFSTNSFWNGDNDVSNGTGSG